MLDESNQSTHATEAFIEFCIANNVAMIHDGSYNPFHGRSEAEKLEWLAFIMFLSCDTAANRGGWDPDNAAQHVEYLLQRPFQNVDEWLGPEGDEWRARCVGRNPTEQFKTEWAAFRDAHRNATKADLEAEHVALCARFHEDQAAGRLQSGRAPHRRRRPG